MNRITPEIAGGVGASPNKVEAAEKVLGKASYIADLKRPNMLFGAILQSPFPHAEIVSYNIESAMALNGVKAIITGDNFDRAYMGPFIKDEGALAKDKVRYLGEPVAAVAATTPEIARNAVGLIKVKYKELPAVLNMHDAIADDAPIIHENLNDYIKIFDVNFLFFS